MALPWERLQRLGAVALVALSAGFFAVRCATSADIPFIRPSAAAPWVMPPVAVDAALRQWGRAEVPVTSYRRVVSLAGALAPGADVSLRLRALRGYDVRLNGDPVPGGSDSGAGWRTERSVPLGPALRAGPNELRIDIANAHGPALLAARIEGLAEPVTTDSSWEVWIDGEPLGYAVPADDTRRNPLAVAVDTPLESLLASRDGLLAGFTVGVVGFLALRRRASGRLRALLPGAALASAAVAWVALFCTKLVALPIELGFDARHHQQYVDLLRANAAVPVATDGWSVYHPPLFYALAAALEMLGEAFSGDAGGTVGLKLLPFLAGLGNVWVAAELCRRLFPEDIRRRVLAAVFAAALPMNLYIAAYFSNETFHTFLAGLALLLTVDLLLAPRVSSGRVVRLGALVGLALLTKYTAVMVGAVALFFVICKLAAVERAPVRRILATLGLFAAPPLLIAGWFYARNVALFGDPLIANWGDMPGATLKWWQQPGFHTAAFYLDFGETFRYPYLSAFTSFWDSLYSTVWGDGGIAGRVVPTQRHPFWNYDYMGATYLMAIPATLFVLAGGVRCVARALRDPDPHRRAAFSFVATLAYAVVFGLLYMSLRLPYFAQAKATYGLVVMPSLALFFADGLAWVDDALRRYGGDPARAALFGWLAAFTASCLLSFLG